MIDWYCYVDYQKRLNLSIDDEAIIKAMVDAAMEEARSAAFRRDMEACRDYCNLYLDLAGAVEDLKAIKVSDKEMEKEEKGLTFYDEEGHEKEAENDAIPIKPSI